MKRTNLILLFLIALLPAAAQWTWHNPLEAGFPTVQNQAFSYEGPYGYFRMPDRAKAQVTPDVWDHTRCSSGLAIYFRSDAKEIKVRYTVTRSKAMAHMPATGVSGLDLYRVSPEGEWQRCWGNYSFGDTVRYTFKSNIENTRYGRGYEYRLYLPMYNSVTWLEIGTPDGASFEFMPVENEKPIVVYGTSIAQGACASRPGMAWTNILQRRLDYPLINFGFSGNGLLAPGVIDLMNEIDARVYILDCLPNFDRKSETEALKLITEAVRRIRSKHDTPILLIDHIGYSNMATDSTMNNIVERVNSANKKAFDILTESGIKNLYLLDRNSLGFDQDCWVDYIHPSDLGMQRQASVVEDTLRSILNIPSGTTQTTRPVTQRRDVNAYEWRNRHDNILHYVDSVKPRKVILGNSITHYWGGSPGHRKKNGAEAWEQFMAPQGFANLGCGWDKIENVLWRVYHGELDGYQADEVVIMIGTNNCGFNTPQEIADGIGVLAKAAAVRQPTAKIKIVGILPRRGKEQWVKEVNNLIEKTAVSGGFNYINPGQKLLLPDGKINEKLFNDGLHPNNAGYTLIAPEIAD